MNKQYWWRTGTAPFIFFVLLIGAGWLVLVQTDYIENPVQSMRSIVEVYQTLQADPATLPPPPSEATSFFADFDWAALPDVLYDLWFICLITATVIMLTHIFAWLNKRLKQ